jgi:hypothetical protein
MLNTDQNYIIKKSIFLELLVTSFIEWPMYVYDTYRNSNCVLCHILNPLRLSGNYMNHLLWQSVMLHFVFIGFAWFSLQTVILSLNSTIHLIFVMVKFNVLFEVRTEFLNKM